MRDDMAAATGGRGVPAATRSTAPLPEGARPGREQTVPLGVVLATLCTLAAVVAVVAVLVGIPWPVALGVAWAAPPVAVAVLLVAGVTSDAIASSRARPRRREVARIPRPRTSAGG
jgi:hypothetical protein